MSYTKELVESLSYEDLKFKCEKVADQLDKIGVKESYTACERSAQIEFQILAKELIKRNQSNE